MPLRWEVNRSMTEKKKRPQRIKKQKKEKTPKTEEKK
jgi:hypothetical protein